MPANVPPRQLMVVTGFIAAMLLLLTPKAQAQAQQQSQEQPVPETFIRLELNTDLTAHHAKWADTLFTVHFVSQAPDARFPRYAEDDHRAKAFVGRASRPMMPYLRRYDTSNVERRALRDALEGDGVAHESAYHAIVRVGEQARHYWVHRDQASGRQLVACGSGQSQFTHLTPGRHEVAFRIRTMDGLEFEGQTEIIVDENDPARARAAVQNAQTRKQLERHIESFEQAPARSYDSRLRGVLYQFRRYVRGRAQYSNATATEIADLRASWRGYLQKFAQAPVPKHLQGDKRQRWIEQFPRRLETEAGYYTNFSLSLAQPGSVEEAIEWRNIVRREGASGESFDMALASAIWSRLGDAARAEKHWDLYYKHLEERLDQQRRAGLAVGSANTLPFLPRNLFKQHDPAPRPPAVVRVEPEPGPSPAPREAAPEPRDVTAQQADDEAPAPELTDRDKALLEAIAEMDRLLEAVEQPLQEGLTQLVMLTRSAADLRRAMRELADLKKDVNDDALKQKIQQRINQTAQDLRDTAGELRETRAATEKVMATTRESVHAIFRENEWASLRLPARTRVELADARAQLLDAQIALASNDTRRAIDLAFAMKGNFRLNGAGHYIDGMALLQQGKPLDALAVFRNARENMRAEAGPAWEALERQTEIQIMRSLQRIAGETASAFDQEFEKWIAGRAETSAPRDQTRFEWFVQRFLKRPLYDTIPEAMFGAGSREADARADEMSVVMSEMAATNAGLNFIIALREQHTLEEIRSFTAEQLQEATRRRWGRDLPEEQLKRMRRLIGHAFQNRDMRLLARGEAHLDADAFSRPLAAQIKLQGAYHQAGEVGALAAGLVDGWTVLTSLAPASKITLAGSLQLQSGATAARMYKHTHNLHEWFAASRVATSAMDKLQRTRAGRVAIDTMRQADAWSGQSAANTLAAAGAQAVIDGGAAYAAQQYLGDEAGMLVDALTTLGVTTPEVYAKTMKNLTREQARAAAAKLADRAAEQTTIVEGAWKLVKDTPFEEGSVDMSRIRVLTEEVAEADLPDALADRIYGLAAAVEEGEPARVVQARRDLGRAIAARRRLIGEARAAARELENAAPRLFPERTGPRTIDSPVELLESTPAREALADASELRPAQQTAPSFTSEISPTGPDARAPVGDPLAAEAPRAGVSPDTPPSIAAPADTLPPVGDPLARAPQAPEVTSPTDAGTLVNPAQVNRAGPSIDGTPPGRAPPRAQAPSTPAAAPRDLPQIQTPPLGQTPQHLAIANRLSPLAQGDRLFARGRYAQAIAEYQRLLAELPQTHPARLEISRRILDARAVMDAADDLSDLAGAAAVSANRPRLHDLHDPDARVQALITGDDAARHWPWISGRPGEAGASASAPRYVLAHDGQPIAVTKYGSQARTNHHPEDRAEELASRLAEALGRDTPRARRSSFEAPDQPGQRLILTEMLPQGSELRSIRPTQAQLLAHKDAIAEDYVFSMLIGDGDRHFKNLWVTADGRVIGFDYGFADIVPDHHYRPMDQIKGARKTIAELTEMIDALESRNRLNALEQVELKDAKRKLEGARRLNERMSLYQPLDFDDVPRPGDPRWEAYVSEQMQRHMAWGSREWADHGELFAEAMTYEDFLPHIEKLERTLAQGNAVDRAIDAAMSGHPDREYTRAILKTRLKVMKEQFMRRFPSIPDEALEPLSRRPALRPGATLHAGCGRPPLAQAA